MRRARGQGGFSLVEVLVGLFLIGIGVLAAAPMFMAAMRGNAVGAELTTAGALAVERMEALRMVPFDLLVDGGDLSANLGGYSDTANPGFDVRWQISSATGPGTMKTVTVRAVSLGPAAGPAKQVTLTTQRAR